MMNMAAKWLLLTFIMALAGRVVLADLKKVVCYYDSRSYWKQGFAKMTVHDIDPTLCTHLIYGYAIIDPSTFRLDALDDYLDLESGKNNYKDFTALKRRNPSLKVLLSVGGSVDSPAEKYLTLVKDSKHRSDFVSSAKSTIKKYGFDGLDLAWEFPEDFQKERGTIGGVWHGIKSAFGYSGKDDHAEEHKNGFTSLMRELKTAFKTEGLMVTAAVLPYVNASLYYDFRAISSYLDQVHLMTFDFHTPQRQPNTADYPAPLYKPTGRKDEQNVDEVVRSWLEDGAQGSKLVLGMPTFGRTWKVSGSANIPPLPADGPGEAGPQTRQPGLLAYYEICSNLTGSQGLKPVNDATKKTGPYAYKLPQWVGYDDIDSVGNKASYTKIKGLAGMAFWDLSLDDFRGVCTGTKFPLIRTAKSRL